MILVTEGITGEAMPDTNREKLERLADVTGIGDTVTAAPQFGFYHYYDNVTFYRQI